MTADVAILMPYRSDGAHRMMSHRFVRAWWHEHFPDWPICYGDTGAPVFDRAASRNVARELAPEGTRVLVIADADTIPSSTAVGIGAAAVRSSLQWILPFETYWNLTEDHTNTILNRLDPAAELPVPIEGNYEHELTDSVAGCVIVHVAAWAAVGGYPTALAGWGYDDNCFARALEIMCGGTRRLPGHIHHLWHPAPEEECFGQPDIEWNRRIYREFQRARNPRLMRKVLDQYGAKPQ